MVPWIKNRPLKSIIAHLWSKINPLDWFIIRTCGCNIAPVVFDDGEFCNYMLDINGL